MMWKPMLPTLVNVPPTDKHWLYEVKYDGFRCGLEWNRNEVKLWSRNGNELTASFPEIIEWCKSHQGLINKQLPLWFDGELVVLRTEFQSIFSLMQQRGRLKSKDKIKEISQKRPATLMIFDILQLRGQSVNEKPLQERRKQLSEIFKQLERADFSMTSRLNIVRTFHALAEIKEVEFLHQCEGIVAKQKSSKYLIGKRSSHWIKVKNYRLITGVITGWNTNNDYFNIAIHDNNEKLTTVGKLKNGFPDAERKTLTTFIQKNGKKRNGFSWAVPPSICVEINCLDARSDELREPFFHQFRFDLSPENCTERQVQVGLAQLPVEIDISKPKKLLFPGVTKQDLVLYLRAVAPFLLPKIRDKRLTMIRYPDGIEAHSFYQKHLPDYAPSYIEITKGDDDEADILCQDLRSLLWFGNHASLEFHVPFQTIHSKYPDEMVFDLDPPTLAEFPLAVTAAQLIKEMIEYHGFTPFVKTSGRTGLQIHIPLEPMRMGFDETRTFMEAVAKVLVDKYPTSFTIERLKKNRGKRLYIDYVQHAAGKTIIAPYSPRATPEARVATPLYWDEVNEQLDPRDYTMANVLERLIEKGCPFY